jgi:hypothetical protein
MGFPAVKVHLLDSDGDALAGFPAEVRRVLAYLDRFLPAFVGDELEVYQSPSVLEPELRAGNDGLVEIMTLQVTNRAGARTELDRLYPHLAQQLVARQLAWQYWGERVPPADAGQRWIAHGLSDTYASFYVRGVYGRQGWLDQLDRSRKTIEDPEKRTEWPVEWHDQKHFLSLSNGGSFAEAEAELLRRYGQYLTSWMLRKKVGDQAFFRTLDRMAEDRNVRGLDTDRFRRWLEWESDLPLQDWFDYWVEGGFVPTLAVEARMVPKADGLEVRGCIATDVPFGRMELPIRVADQRSPEDQRRRAERALQKAEEEAEKARRQAASGDGGRDPVEQAIGRMDAAMAAAAATDGRWIEGLVDVVDGYGSFLIPGRAPDAEVRVDPEGLIIAYGRTLTLVPPEAPATACEQEIARRAATPGEGG